MVIYACMQLALKMKTKKVICLKEMDFILLKTYIKVSLWNVKGMKVCWWLVVHEVQSWLAVMEKLGHCVEAVFIVLPNSQLLLHSFPQVLFLTDKEKMFK